MAIAVAPATCHRCKQAIAPGDDIRRYNRPAIGTLYHAVCPGSTTGIAPTPQQPSAPLAQHAGSLTADAVDAIVSKVTAALASQRTAPTASEPSAASEPASEPECSYSQALVEDGYEPMGYDCPGHDWLPLATAERTLDDAKLELRGVYEDLAKSAASAEHGAYLTEALPGVTDETSALAHCMRGLSAHNAKSLMAYADGLHAGMLLAVSFMRGDAPKRETLRVALSRDDWRAQQSELSLAVLVDDDAADAMMASEAAMVASVGCTCTLTDAGDVATPCTACAARGATAGPWKPEQHALWEKP